MPVTADLTPELETLRSWIVSKRPSNAGITIDLDTDLLGTRVIDSLDFAEFLFVVEETYGEVIDLDRVSLETFRSLGSITAHFKPQGGNRV